MRLQTVRAAGTHRHHGCGERRATALEPQHDLIASIAALHHMDQGAALSRMRALLAPGGTLAIVGLARPRYPADLPFAAAGAIAHRAHRLRKPYWEDSAPRVWAPPGTFRQMRRLARGVLPGVRYRRLVLWRYSLVWTKPAAATAAAPGPDR